MLHRFPILQNPVVLHLQAFHSSDPHRLGTAHPEDIVDDLQIPRVGDPVFIPIRPPGNKPDVVRALEGVAYNTDLPQTGVVLSGRIAQVQADDASAGAVHLIALDGHVLRPGQEGVTHVGSDLVVANHRGPSVVIEVHHLRRPGDQARNSPVESHPVSTIPRFEDIGGGRPHAENLLRGGVEKLQTISFPDRIVVIMVG